MQGHAYLSSIYIAIAANDALSTDQENTHDIVHTVEHNMESRYI